MSARSPRSARRRLALAALVGLAALAGCAQPPVYIAANHQRIVPMAPSDVWRRLHEFLQNLQIPVVSEDPQAGILDASLAAADKDVIDRYAYCSRHWNGLHPLAAERLDLTVLVQPSPDGSKVTANAAFSQTLRQRHAGALTLACPSKGVLETAVLNVASGQPMDAAVVPQ